MFRKVTSKSCSLCIPWSCINTIQTHRGLLSKVLNKHMTLCSYLLLYLIQHGGQSSKVTTIPGSTWPTGTVPIQPLNILEWKTEGIVWWLLGLADLVKYLKESWSLIPVKVGRPLNHVVILKNRDGNDWDFSSVVSKLLQVRKHLPDNLIVPTLGVYGCCCIHLIRDENHLLDTKGEASRLCSRVYTYLEISASKPQWWSPW